MSIINWYHRMSQKRNIKRNAEYIHLSKETFYDETFYLDLRNHQKGHIYLDIKSSSVVGGIYIFERESGYIEIGERAHIGKSTFISVNEIIIGDDVTIAWDCLFYDHNSHSVVWEERKNDTIQELKDIRNGDSPIKNKDWSVVKSAPIHIEDKVWIGTGCKILKGVTIGEGAVVAAGSVVVKDVAPWTMVGGNPAVVIKKLERL